MNDGGRLFVGVGSSIVLSLLAVVLLLCLEIPIWMFLAMIAVSVIIAFVPLASTKGDWVSIGDDGVVIKAPFVDLSIPFSSIQSADMVTGFKPGIRIFGYGLLKRGSGSFTNEMLGNYTFAGTTAVNRMIVIRSSNKKIGIVALNLPSENATQELFDKIAEAVGTSPAEMPPMDVEGNRESYRSMKRAVVALSAIIIVAVAAILIFTMTTGHVDAYLEEDSLVIDATGMHKTVPYESIISVELRYDVDYGTRTGGIANSKILTGNFRNDEFGNYHLAVNRGVEACIVVFTEGKSKVFNLHSNEETESFFLNLQSKTLVSDVVIVAETFEQQFEGADIDLQGIALDPILAYDDGRDGTVDLGYDMTSANMASLFSRLMFLNAPL